MTASKIQIHPVSKTGEEMKQKNKEILGLERNWGPEFYPKDLEYYFCISLADE